MKNIILVITFLTLLLTRTQQVYAENSLAEDIEENDVHKLIVDPNQDVPEEKIVPQPTPSPASAGREDEPKADNRAWNKSKYRKLISQASEKYSVDPQVIYATIMTESEGDEYAFRYEPQIKDASLCLGQILISTAKRLGFNGKPKDLYKPAVCIDLIGKYHRAMLDAYGNLSPQELAIAYNAGSPYKRAVPGHVFRFNKWYNET